MRGEGGSRLGVPAKFQDKGVSTKEDKGISRVGGKQRLKKKERKTSKRRNERRRGSRLEISVRFQDKGGSTREDKGISRLRNKD